jgi:hypothetical protein
VKQMCRLGLGMLISPSEDEAKKRAKKPVGKT